MKMKNRVLAVLVLALLMINMMPVRTAEAAESKFYTVAWGNSNKTFEVPDGQYYVYWHVVASNNWHIYMFMISEGPFYCSNYSIGNRSGGYCWKVVSKDGGLSYIVEKERQNISGTLFGVGSLNVENVYTNCNIATEGSDSKVVFPANPLDPEPVTPEPVTFPVTEPGYEYWLYHKTTSGEYMYWSKDPFDLEVSEGKYILNLSTGDIVYRLHMSPSHRYYRQVLAAPVQYVISPGDVFRSGQDLAFGDVTIDAWTTGDVTAEEVVPPDYDIPHITKFLDRVRSVRRPQDGPREYSMSINLALSGEFDEAVSEQKVLIDGNYILPSEEYFRYCDSEGIDPSTTHFMKFVKNKQKEYYILVDWSHIEPIVNLAGLTSDYGFRLTYSNAIDALIARGEFDKLYSESVQVAYNDDIRKMCCPYRLACTLIGVVDEEYYYGETYITVLYSELDDTTEDVSGVYSDYVSLDNDQKTDAIESTINEAQDDKLQEYIEKKDAELDALIEEYEMKLAALDTSASFGGAGDLFATFSSVANGIAGLSGSFRKIAVAVGNVFAFFPEEFTSLLYAGFAICIVVAVYKALRG